MIAVEKSIDVGGLRKRYDIVVFDRAHTPWMLIECKRPDVAINKDVLWQVATYHNLLQCPYWLMTNGHTTYCAEVKDANCINWLPHLQLNTLLPAKWLQLFGNTPYFDDFCNMRYQPG